VSALSPRFTLALLSRDLSSTTLAAVGAGTFDSSYTEDGAGPGTPEPQEDGSTWRVQIGQAQSVGLTVGTARGGYPGLDGAQVVYRLASDSASTDYRSWQDPVLITGWSAPTGGWASNADWDQIAVTVIAETGVIVIVAVDQDENDAQTFSWDPRTDTWTSLYDWDAGAADGLVLPVGLAYDAARARLLLWSGYNAAGVRQQTAYESTDGGTTWTIYSRGFAEGFTDDSGTGVGTYSTTGSFYPVIGDDLDWLMIANEDLSDLTLTMTTPDAANGVHLASSDAGVTWDLITDLSAVGPGQPLKSPAGFVYCKVDLADSNHLKAVITASARARFSTSVTISSARSYSGCWACADADGTLYVVGRGASGAATIGKLHLFRSLDGGLTWDDYGWLLWDSGSSSHYLDPRALVAAQGKLHLVCTSQGTGTPNSIQVVSLGGWSQVAHGSGATNYVRNPTHRFGWGGTDSTATNGYALGYLPFALPANVGWTGVTTTGTTSLAAATPALLLTTTAGQGERFSAQSSNNATYAACDIDVKLDASGNVTLATLGTAGGGVGILMSMSKAGGAGWFYELGIDIGTDGIQVRDAITSGTPTIRSTVALDMTSQFTRIRAHLTKGTATVWYSRDYGVTWTRLSNGVTITDNGTGVASGGDILLWGNGTTQVGKSYWRLVGFAAAADWQYGVDGINAVGDSPASGPLGHAFGKAVAPPSSGGYPIPEGTASGADLALLSATGGPTHTGEIVSLPVAHQYGAENIDPIVSPSPRRTWRSLANTAAAFVWDQGANEEKSFGGALALVVSSTVRQWVLQIDDGASPPVGWTTLGTLDLAAGTGLTFTRTGRTIAPDTGTATLSRRFAENEFAGGTWTFDDGTCCKIASSTGGFWTDSTSVKQMTITLEAVAGTEPSSGSAGILCAPAGVLVVYPSSQLRRRYVRARAAASQPCVGGQYEAGCVAVGRLVALSDPEWTWSATTGLVRQFATSSDGVTTATELGPAVRTLTYTWGTAPLAYAQTLATAPDMFKGTGGVGIGSALNAPVDLPGLVAQLESGAIPCVVIPRAPAAAASTTDPRRFLLGRVSSGSLSVGASSGTEGTNEFATGPSLSVVELK
jgi:hypothetical protein